MPNTLDDTLRGDLAGLRATLIGLGRRTHVALARYLVHRGAIVRISELRPFSELADELALIAGLPVDVRAGGHANEHVDDADVVFVTPGAPRELPILEYARRRDVPIASEIELVFARCHAPIIGITGSAGKTTTTSLVGEMLRRGGFETLVGGNIGVPLVERIDDVSATARVVLELSSFQLEGLRRGAAIGAILNVTPNHTDRHPTFDHYRESKFNLLRYQTADDIAVLGYDDPVARSLESRCPGQVRWFSAKSVVAHGTFRRDDILIAAESGDQSVIIRAGEILLPGEHNVLNALAASAVARSAGVSLPAIADTLRTFRGVEHRIELTRTLGGVRYFNDSIATSPERTVAALRTFSDPIVLIAGGRSKHLPLDELAALASEKCRAVVAFGEMADEIVDALHRLGSGDRALVVKTTGLADAVGLARNASRPGDVVLMSPAGTSFDQFRDFEERGRVFKAIVAALTDGV